MSKLLSVACEDRREDRWPMAEIVGFIGYVHMHISVFVANDSEGGVAVVWVRVIEVIATQLSLRAR